MNIVIVGAGDVGLYLSMLLSKQKHNVVLIDKNKAKLEELTWQMDVAIQQGSGTDWELLEQLLEIKPDLFIALTDQDEINLTACTIAKHLGYTRTIARVRGKNFLNRTRLDFGRLFQVDTFINPELLLAYDLYKYIISPGSIALENFVHGDVQMRTLQVSRSWKFDQIPLSQLELPPGMIVALIYRQRSNEEPILIFPHGSDHIFAGDEVTLIGERKQMVDVHQFFGIQELKADKVVIVGGSLVGTHLAKILTEHRIQVTLVDKNRALCNELANELPECTIIHQEGTAIDFLLSERINPSDYFIMCTSNEELNVLGALLAKEAGCENIAMILSTNRFLTLVHQLGIVHVASPKLTVANRMIALATSKAITSLVSLYENEAEILEITVSLNSPIIGIPLSDIGPRLPRDFLIAMIQNRGCLSIAKGNSVICPGDTLIVVCNPKYFQELENIF